MTQTKEERRVANRASSKRFFKTEKGKAARARAYAKHGARQTKKYRAKLRAITNQHKDKPCADCGRCFHPVCMDFDHRPGELKKFQISNLGEIQGGLAGMLAEIAKCDVVCANCHRLRTHTRLLVGLGTEEE